MCSDSTLKALALWGASLCIMFLQSQLAACLPSHRTWDIVMWLLGCFKAVPDSATAWISFLIKVTCKRAIFSFWVSAAMHCEDTPMRHRKTACFEALFLEPHFDQILGRPMFACLPFLAFLGPKTDPFFVIYIVLLQFP